MTSHDARAETAARPKFYALDALRGLAALFVLGRHSLDYWPGTLFRSYLAVDVFFLLSGFVIAHSYEGKLESGRMSAGEFLRVRLIRLYPLYALTLLFALFLNGPHQPAELLIAALKGALMLPSLGESATFPLNSVYWSLFFELLVNALYVAFRPALVGYRLTCLVGLLGVLLIYLERSTGGLDIGMYGTPFHFLSGLVRASFGIFFGVLLYRRRYAIWPSLSVRAGPYLASLGVCIVLCIPDIGRFTWAVDALAVLVLFPLCMMAASAFPPSSGQGLMEYLGRASYPLYLLHPLLAKFGVTMLSAAVLTKLAPLSGVLFTLLAVALSESLDRYVDAPMRARISEFFLRRRAKLARQVR